MGAPQRRQRGRRERGVALVEFALVSVLLFILIFGIISFAYMLSFRQAISQGAAEGARAGAVAPASLNDVTAKNAARTALNNALESYDVECTGTELMRGGTDAGSCNITVGTCAGSTKRCVSVEVVYEYEDNALVPSLPVVSQALPDDLHYTAVAEINTL